MDENLPSDGERKQVDEHENDKRHAAGAAQSLLIQYGQAIFAGSPTGPLLPFGTNVYRPEELNQWGATTAHHSANPTLDAIFACMRIPLPRVSKQLNVATAERQLPRLIMKNGIGTSQIQITAVTPQKGLFGSKSGGLDAVQIAAATLERTEE